MVGLAELRRTSEGWRSPLLGCPAPGVWGQAEAMHQRFARLGYTSEEAHEYRPHHRYGRERHRVGPNGSKWFHRPRVRLRAALDEQEERQDPLRIQTA